MAFRRTLQKYLLDKPHSLREVGLQYRISTFDPSLHFVFDQKDVAVGAFTTHIDDVLGCGAYGILDLTRKFLELRSGPLEIQESEFVHVGMELSQGSDFSVRLTQSGFTESLLPMDTSPSLWANRQLPLGDEDKLRCQCKLGELCWLATVSRPDICARLAHIASRVNMLKGSDIYCTNDLIKTVKLRQPRTVLKYASSSAPPPPRKGTLCRGFVLDGRNSSRVLDPCWLV